MSIHCRIILASAFLVTGSAHAAPAADVVTFQSFRQETTATFADADKREGVARLTNLNANVNGWYVLAVKWPGAARETIYNLERPDSKSYDLAISNRGLTVTVNGKQTACDLFLDSSLLRGANRDAYVPLCEGKVLVRNQAHGTSGDAMSWGAGLLRDTLGSTGNDIVAAVKDLREDSGLVQAQTSTSDEKPFPVGDRPSRAIVSKSAQKTALTVPDLQIELEGAGRSLLSGAWYKAKNNAGVFFSAMQPSFVEESILNSYRDRANALDSVEASALSYMVAFDLSQFELGWAHGTKLPGVAWSPQQPASRRGSSLSGPDGFDSLNPLVLTGKINPTFLPRLAAVMCGGFQRMHSVFGSGVLGNSNNGSYYGFIENGVVLSHLNPGLATAISYTDGRFDIKTWTEKDNESLSKIRYARQNGVPLVESDAQGNAVPGALVKRWGDGNWSGNVAGKKRSQRAGACISEQNGKRYLIYGYFSSANPDAMAQVFRSYNCQYAIHLDMNSAGQGYIGLLSRSGGKVFTENPVREMSARNTTMKADGKSITTPRYVGRSDEADFFYFLRK
ncbi:hypothetical protein BH10BDE1_BH10BDE1_01290 [soil metagenome]